MIIAVKSVDMLIEGVLDNGLAFIGQYLEKILHRPVIITDNNGQIHFPERNDTATIIDETFIIIPAWLDNNEYYYQEERGNLFYCIELKPDNAYVIVQNLPADLIQDVVAILRESRLPVKCYFSKLNIGNERLEKELADYLFTQNHADLRDILHLSDNEMDINRPYCVSIMQVEEARVKINPSIICSYAGEYLKREKLKAISVYSHNQLAFIIPVNTKKDTPEMNLIDNSLDIAAFKQAIDSRYKITSSIGTGQVYPLINLEKSFDEARIAIILNHLMGRRNIIQEFSQLGIYQPIFSQDIKNIRDYSSNILGKLIEHDFKSEGELLPTLRKLLDACGNIKATADSLFIHVNTLYYRINKIEQILDIDLGKMDTRVELHTAIKVWDTLQILHGEKETAVPDSEAATYAMEIAR